MFNFFKKKSSSINVNLLSFEVFGWKTRDTNPNLKSWVKTDKTAFIGVELNKVPYPYQVHEIEEIIDTERSEVIASDFGGIISCEIQNIKGYDFIKTIVKSPVSPVGIPPGMNYLGSLKLPLKDCYFEIMIKISEKGTSGMRDSILFSKWFQENGELESHENGQIKGWVKDPYDESIVDGRPMNMSEQEKYDNDFPDHPLSELRQKMNMLKESMIIDEKMEKYKID